MKLKEFDKITPEIANKLESLLDIPASFWLELENNYQKDLNENADLLSKVIAICVLKDYFDDKWFENYFIKYCEEILINLDDFKLHNELAEWRVSFNNDQNKLLKEYILARKKVIQKAFNGSFQRWFLATFWTDPIIKALKSNEIQFK